MVTLRSMTTYEDNVITKVKTTKRKYKKKANVCKDVCKGTDVFIRCSKNDGKCSNIHKHRGRCNKRYTLSTKSTSSTSTSTNTTTNATNTSTTNTSTTNTTNTTNTNIASTVQEKTPWYTNISDRERLRYQLFGIRLKMYIQKKYVIGTVVAYLPAMKQHLVRFDGESSTHSFDLIKERKWNRVPWTGNVLDDSYIGEKSVDTMLAFQTFGPDCPRCAAFLGIGEEAWSFCKMCKLNEPGACMWTQS